jgi:4-hydroxy-4-methyl-2-oxoglutarate aldolase
MVVPATELAATLVAGERRQANEEEKREKLASGVLGLDLMKCVQHLRRLGYVMSRDLRTPE